MLHACCCQLHVRWQLPREISIAAAGSRCGAVQVRQLSSAALCNDIVCRAAKQVLATCASTVPACSTGDDACAHPFSGWQVQVEKDEASLVRAPCNVLQVGMHTGMNALKVTGDHEAAVEATQ